MGWCDSVRRVYGEVKYLSELMAEQRYPWIYQGPRRWKHGDKWQPPSVTYADAADKKV